MPKQFLDHAGRPIAANAERLTGTVVVRADGVPAAPYSALELSAGKTGFAADPANDVKALDEGDLVELLPSHFAPRGGGSADLLVPARSAGYSRMVVYASGDTDERGVVTLYHLVAGELVASDHGAVGLQEGDGLLPLPADASGGNVHELWTPDVVLRIGHSTGTSITEGDVTVHVYRW